MNVTRYIHTLKLAENAPLLENGSPTVCVHRDHLGLPTIGFGITYWQGEKITMDTPPITYRLALDMLYAKATRAIIEASVSTPSFNELCDVRQECLSEMAFQLGGRGLRLFKKMLAAVERKDWYAAHDEIWDSKMGRDPQLHSRVDRYAKMMLMGRNYDMDSNGWH